MVTYRTDDPARWGIGKGSNLTAPEIDGNFWELAQRLVSLETNPTEPNNISAITVAGSQMTVHMVDGSTHGPFTLPSAMIHYRGDWAPGVSYDELDVISAPNNGGIYLVARAHVSATTFDRAAVDAAGNPLYQWLFPTQASTLAALSDVSDTAATGGQSLVWNATAAVWEPTTIAGGSLDSLSDVTITAPVAGHVPRFDGAAWVNAAVGWADVSGKPATVAAIPAAFGTAGQVLKVNATVDGYVWGDDASGGGALTDLSDVTITTPTAAQFVRFDGTAWVNAAAAWADVAQKPATINAIPGTLGAAGTILKVSADGTTLAWAADESSGTSGALNDLSDVAITTPASGHVVQFDGTGWVNSTLAWGEIPDKPATFPPSAHTHPWADVTGRPATINAIPATLGAAGQVMKVDAAGTGIAWAADDTGAGGGALNDLSDVTIATPATGQVVQFDGTGWVNSPLAWAEIPDKPASFPPSAHTHPWSDVTSRPATIDAIPPTLGTAGQILKVDAAGTGIAWAADDSGSGTKLARQTATASYSVVDADLAGSRLLRMDVAGANTVTVPAGLAGTEPMTIVQQGAGQTSFVAGTGVTIKSAGGLLALRAQYASGTLIPDGLDTFYLVGDLG